MADITPSTQFLSVPGGSIAYDVRGEGPLVVMLPGMGDLRATYRFLAPRVAAAGYRVATADLRGHGESSASFASYGDVETASDLTALLDHLDSPAIVVGNSMAAGAGVIAAAERPELITALVLVGPFVRKPQASAGQRVLLRVLMGGPWATAMWNAYLPTLYRGRKPEDFQEYRGRIKAAMRRPGHAKAFRRTTRTDHEPAERVLGSVRAPALVVMGREDPDFKDPEAEAGWIGTTLGGEVAMIDDAGHYPQAQQPVTTGKAVLDFLRRVHPVG
ncbi:MAG TPA: alpha/beta hydrolase [Beutenbergiaceae bacterium]|nr:alpha/beta hydrolase [Beutenbergiaceae bacterium]